MADSGAVQPRTHASKATRAHTGAAHTDVAHADVTHPTTTHSTTVAHPTHSGRRIKRRTGDDGRRGGQGDHYLTHHDCVLQLATDRTSSLLEPRRLILALTAHRGCEPRSRRPRASVRIAIHSNE